MLSKKCKKQKFSVGARLSVGAAGLCLLLGCSDTADGPGESAASSAEESTVTSVTKFERSDLLGNILDNAIQVGDDLYMMPKGIDEDGCEMFGPYSENNPTVTALQYRQADGSFDIAKDPAVCGVEMVSLGKDTDGCEMYRAQPVNGVLEATEVVYYQDADGRYVPRKPAASCS